MSKSHVSMEQHQCPICGKVHDTGNLLFDMRLRQRLERNTLTGHSECPDCTAKINEGYVALIGAEMIGGTPNRTGDLLWLKEEAWGNIMTVPVPPKRVCFVDPDVVKAVTKLAAQAV